MIAAFIVTAIVVLAVMAGQVLRLSRQLSRTMQDRNDWRDHARILAKRATRAERDLEVVSDDRNDLVIELGQVRRSLIETIEQRDCVRDIADGLFEELDIYRKELRGGEDSEEEMVN